MPKYYFDVKNGTRLADSSGLECLDDEDAKAKALVIAREIAAHAPPVRTPRRISILDENGDEVSIVPVQQPEQKK
jgi:hypothetical protein